MAKPGRLAGADEYDPAPLAGEAVQASAVGPGVGAPAEFRPVLVPTAEQPHEVGLRRTPLHSARQRELRTSMSTARRSRTAAMSWAGVSVRVPRGEDLRCGHDGTPRVCSERPRRAVASWVEQSGSRLQPRSSPKGSASRQKAPGIVPSPHCIILIQLIFCCNVGRVEEVVPAR